MVKAKTYLDRQWFETVNALESCWIRVLLPHVFRATLAVRKPQFEHVASVGISTSLNEVEACKGLTLRGILHVPESKSSDVGIR